MLHWPGQAPPRPIEVPWRMAVGGPKGMAAARRMGAGIFASRPAPGTTFDGYPAVTAMVSGTVVEPGESAASDRVLNACGPGIAVRYHMAYENKRLDAIAGWPNGPRFIELLGQIDPATRHLQLHEGHLSHLNAIDRQVIDHSTLSLSPLWATAAEVPAWIEGFAAMGVTELAFEPMGDIPAELRRFARAARL